MGWGGGRGGFLAKNYTKSTIWRAPSNSIMGVADLFSIRGGGNNFFVKFGKIGKLRANNGRLWRREGYIGKKTFTLAKCWNVYISMAHLWNRRYKLIKHQPPPHFPQGRVALPKRMNFGKVSNGLWTPLIFGNSYCNFFFQLLAQKTFVVGPKSAIYFDWKWQPIFELRRWWWASQVFVREWMTGWLLPDPNARWPSIVSIKIILSGPNDY